MAEKSYRRCVVAVIKNQEGLVLVGERADASGNWQFPQGGVDEGESDELALRREVLEEIGVADFEIEHTAADLVRYDFPPELKGKITERYRGQEQRWFLLKLAGAARPDLAKATDKEFQRLAWIDPSLATSGIIEWKRKAYEEGLQRLGLKGDKS